MGHKANEWIKFTRFITIFIVKKFPKSTDLEHKKRLNHSSQGCSPKALRNLYRYIPYNFSFNTAKWELLHERNILYAMHMMLIDVQFKKHVDWIIMKSKSIELDKKRERLISVCIVCVMMSAQYVALFVSFSSRNFQFGLKFLYSIHQQIPKKNIMKWQ